MDMTYSFEESYTNWAVPFRFVCRTIRENEDSIYQDNRNKVNESLNELPPVKQIEQQEIERLKI